MEKNIYIFTEKLASKAPTPGGGGVAAIAGALGSALASMVCELTVGKSKYQQYEAELTKAMSKAKSLSKEFLALAEKDEVVFEPLSRAYSLPSSTDEEKQHKDEVMEKCLLDAMLTPYEVAKLSYETIVLLSELVEKGSKLAISDVGCGAALAESALKSAALNVYINTKFMKSADAPKYTNEVKALVEKGSLLAEKIYDDVKDMLVK